MWIDDQPADVLDTNADSPLHRQLGDVLRRAITGGELPPGAQLPTEAEFQHRFRISRSVVRQALSSLAHDGLIRRGRGRGSVVAPQHEHHRAVQKMTGLSAQISTSEDAVTTEVLCLGRASDSRAERALGSTDLLEIKRRRSVNGEAIAIIHTWLPRDLVPGLAADDLVDASLHSMLATRFGVPVSAGHRQVRAVAASETLAGALSLPIASPLLVLEGTSQSDGGAAVEYFCTWHRADRVVFDVDAGHRPSDDRPAHLGTLASPAAGLRTSAISLADQLRTFADRLSDSSETQQPEPAQKGSAGVPLGSDSSRWPEDP
jgi:GntR family transcriptional regulator